MNPSLMNYLQNQSSDLMTGGQQQPQQGMQSARPGQDSYNPFDAGIQKAISSARESLGMTPDQEDAALRGSMLTFADNMSQQPRQKGFFNNFASVGRALSPAIQAHDQSEQAALTQNNALANQILAYQAAEQQKQAQQEERLWHRKHAESQLGEQRRYHNMMYGASGLGGLEASNNGEFIPIQNKTVLNKYTEDKKKYGSGLKQLDDLIKHNNEIEKDYKESLISPTGPFSKLTASAEDLYSVMAGNKALKEKAAKRENLNSEFVELKAKIEQAIKHGTLGPKILEYFDKESVYPSITDTAEKRKEKLESIRKKISEAYESADLSLKYKVQLEPYNLEQFKNYLNPQQQTLKQEVNTPPASQDQQSVSGNDSDKTPYIWVRNDNTGEKEEIHPDDLAILQSNNKAWKKI